MQISKIVNLGHRSKSKTRPKLNCIKQEDFNEISNSISPRYNINSYTQRTTRQNSHQNANQKNIRQPIIYKDVIKDSYGWDRSPDEQEQVIIINNRKFIKSKSPPKDHSSSQPAPHINQNNLHTSTAQNIKVKILENRISQLHRQKQKQYIQLLNQNKRLEQELELERTRTKNNMKESLMTPIKKISDNEDLYFSQHEIRIGSMKKKIIDLENALEIAKCQKGDCYREADIPISQNGMVRRTPKPFESIINQRQHVENSQNFNKIIESLQKQQKNLTKQIENQSSQINRIKFQNLMKTDLVLQKQQLIQNLTKKNMQSEILIAKLKKSNEELSENIQKLLTEIENQKINQKIENQYKIPIKYAESGSIDPSSICDEKLKDISVGCSVLIKQSYHSKKQSAIPHISKKNSAYQQSIVEEFEEMDIGSDLNSEQFCNQQAMCNILEKIQQLNETNDRILVENKGLGSKVLQLTQANQKLEDTLQQIYHNLHKKQREIDAVKEENQNLRKNIKQLEFFNESTLKTKLSQKLIELEYSQCSDNKWYKKSCEKCQELIRLITKISSEAQKLDMRNLTF